MLQEGPTLSISVHCCPTGTPESSAVSGTGEAQPDGDSSPERGDSKMAVTKGLHVPSELPQEGALERWGTVQRGQLPSSGEDVGKDQWKWMTRAQKAASVAELGRDLCAGYKADLGDR